MENNQVQLRTMASLFNTANLENFHRLTKDIINALHHYVLFKDDCGTQPNLPDDWILLWTDDGKIDCTMIIKPTL